MKKTMQVKSVDGRWLDLASTYRENPREKYRIKPAYGEEMKGCDVCLCSTDEELTYLDLSVIGGSNGINTCRDCTLNLTQAAKFLRRTASVARMDGFSAGKDCQRRKSEKM